MKKVFKWIGIVLLSPILLFVILTILIYLPPVQNWLVGKAASYASEKTGMEITIEHVNLAFPLDLGVDGIRVLHPNDSLPGTKDTIADIKRLVVDVQFMPLFEKKVVINEVALTKSRLNTNGFVASVRVKGDVEKLSVSSNGIDLSKQIIELNGGQITRAHLDIAVSDTVPPDTTKTPFPWIIMADSICVRESAVCLHLPNASRIGALDLGNIALSDLNVRVDSLMYHDPELALRLHHLSLKEQSGLEITELSGSVRMDSLRLSLPQLTLRTAESEVLASFDTDLTVADSLNPGKMNLLLDARLGKQDLLRFIDGLPTSLVSHYPEEPLSVKGRVHGNLQRMEFTGVDIQLPSVLRLTANGYAHHLTNLDALRTQLDIEGETHDVSMLTSMLDAKTRSNYRIPGGVAIKGQLKADGQRYSADLVAREGGGTLQLKGFYHGVTENYEADVRIRNLNLHHWMPKDSLYTLTADLKAKGHGTNIRSPYSTLQADAVIQQLRYGHMDLTDMTAHAQLSKGRAQASLESHNDLMEGTIFVDALLSMKSIQATVTADVQKADLYRLRLTDEPLMADLSGRLDVKSSRDTTWAQVMTGDFALQLSTKGGYEQLLKQSTAWLNEAMRQWKERVINQPKLKSMLPTAHLYVSSGQDNPLVKLFRSSKITFKDFYIDMTTSPERGVNGNAYIHSLNYDSIRIDTINLSLKHKDTKLTFQGQVRNNKRNPQIVFNALFDGFLHKHGATFGVRYFDADNKMGLRLGASADLEAEGIRLHLIPEQPTIGYKLFHLNPDNFLYLGKNNRIEAKIDLLADDGTGVKIYSEESDPTLLQDLTVSLHEFNLDDITSVIPYVPRMTGYLNGDYHVVQGHDKQFSVVSDMSIRDWTYQGSPVGNISTELVYMQKDDNMHAVEARLMRDDVEFGLLKGNYHNTGDGYLDATFKMTRLPMEILNGFVPGQLFGFDGYAQGLVDVKGPLSRPQVNGEMHLDSAHLLSVPYGVSLRFDEQPIRVVGNNLVMEKFKMYASDDNSLEINGNVNFSDFDKILVKVRMRAENYELINAKETNKSIVFGKAYVNFMGMLQGTLDNLDMRGRLDVLGTTDMSYILRDSPLTTDNQLDELVKFRDFSDTTQVVVKRPPLSGFKMDLTLDISKGAHIMAYLNAAKSNYIDLMGGGTLRLRYTPAEQWQLTGKYTLNNGEMKYSLQAIPLKTFTIQDGSYVEFIGDIMNPRLHITATERIRATVAGASGADRSVDFDCGVIITKTLADMGLEFTLDAPNDMQIHSELETMGKDQRGKLAVTMLTTGMYLADGGTGKFSMNSALSSFLNSEISQITGKALRTIDMSFDMENGLDGKGNTRTDYSFKFAKRFWNNRIKLTVGSVISSGANYDNRNRSFFDNVSIEYRLDNSANKYLNFFYENNSYDWLDGYTQKYGAGFIWRKSLNRLRDLFKKEQRLLPPKRPVTMPTDPATPAAPASPTKPASPVDSVAVPVSVPNDSITSQRHEK